MRLPTRKLDRGALLYHGTSAPADFAFPDGPAWFSDARAVADEFQSRHAWSPSRPRTLVFSVSESPELLLVNSRADFDAFEDEHEELPNDPVESAEVVCRAGYDGWIIPDNYPEGADIMICRPERWLTAEAPAPRRRTRRK
jgi:hypothetical protein